MQAQAWQAIAAAAAAGGVWGALSGRSLPYVPMALLVLAGRFGHPWAGLWLTAGSVAAGLVWRGVQHHARRNRQEAELEGFLRRLRQLLGAGHPPARALDDALGRAYRWVVPVSGLETPAGLAAALNELERCWPVPEWRAVTLAWRLIERRGGNLPLVVERTLQALRRRRQRRLGDQLEAASAQSALAVLTGAPAVVLGMFRLWLPALWRGLAQSEAGHWALTWVILSTAAVWVAWVQVAVGEEESRAGSQGQEDRQRWGF